jgi:eukaryotic-like serine/threonine-protein kinase
MEQIDPAAFSDRVINLGLIKQEQLEEIREELGERNPPVQDMLRVLERKRYLTPWQSSKLLKGEQDGYFLGGYRILYKIASGSFGRVFRAEESATGRMVAIKVLRRRWSDEKEYIDRFTHEGKVGLQLKHENIVEVVAINHDPASKQHYIVMEFVEGGDLREILNIRKKLEVKEALKIIEDAAAGLAHAYSRGVTHRDIKLTNILISSQGSAKLVDFGLAQFYAGSSKQDEKNRKERTVDYAGLEKATGVKKGDVRSDIFFLGCVLYELLTGRPPIEMTRDRSARRSARRFEDVQPLPPSEVSAPPTVFVLVDTMLSLDPHRRFQTPSQLLEAIRSARRDGEGKQAGAGAGASRANRTLFIVERDETLQEKMREKFKALGYRVFMSAEPTRALERYHQQPFDALLVNAQTIGEDGRLLFQQIMTDAIHKRLVCVGILLLAPEQAEWTKRLTLGKTAAILQHPVKFTHVVKKFEELFDAAVG